jgi:CheY-like chemotaxis protein
MDGLEATRAIRIRETGRGVHTPIIGVTAHALTRDRERCLAAGMDAHLSKPVEPDELFAAIERHLSSEAGPSSPQQNQPADPAAVPEALAGRAGLLAPLVRSFLESCPTHVGNLREAIAEGDPERLSFGAHRFLGSLGILGAKAAADLAQALEHMGTEGRLDNASAVFEEFERELGRVTDSLSRY